MELRLIQSYALSYNTDIIFLFDTFVHSSAEASDPNINISGYNSLRSDHPLNTKREGVRMFYKDCLPVIRLDDLCALSACIVTEIKLGKKSIFFTCNYKSPSQTPDKFENYCQNFHLTLSNTDNTSPFCLIVIEDFNARCRNWWAGDVNSNAGKELDFLTSTAGYTQLINKPTHLFSGESSCINLIFCNNPEIVSECGIDHLLSQTCHHNLIFAKITANVSLPLNYCRDVWDYKNVNVEGIRKPISLFNWEKNF